MLVMVSCIVYDGAEQVALTVRMREMFVMDYFNVDNDDGGAHAFLMLTGIFTMLRGYARRAITSLLQTNFDALY